MGKHIKLKYCILPLVSALLLGHMSSWAMPLAEQVKLLPNDGAANDFFGYSVALSGDTTIIGAFKDDDKIRGVDVGSAYVFILKGNTWVEQAKLTAKDGMAEDTFGGNVALSGDTAIIGVIRDDDDANGIDSGSAYVFTRTGTSWNQQAKLTANDATEGDYLGYTHHHSKCRF